MNVFDALVGSWYHWLIVFPGASYFHGFTAIWTSVNSLSQFPNLNAVLAVVFVLIYGIVGLVVLIGLWCAAGWFAFTMLAELFKRHLDEANIRVQRRYPVKGEVTDFISDIYISGESFVGLLIIVGLPGLIWVLVHGVAWLFSR